MDDHISTYRIARSEKTGRPRTNWTGTVHIAGDAPVPLPAAFFTPWREGQGEGQRLPMALGTLNHRSLPPPENVGRPVRAGTCLSPRPSSDRKEPRGERDGVPSPRSAWPIGTNLDYFKARCRFLGTIPESVMTGLMQTLENPAATPLLSPSKPHAMPAG